MQIHTRCDRNQMRRAKYLQYESVYQIIYFGLFLDIVAADTNALFAPLLPAPEGGGKVLLGDGPNDPLPVVLEGLLGQRHASQLGLHSREQKKVCQGEIRRIGWAGDCLHPFAAKKSTTVAAVWTRVFSSAATTNAPLLWVFLPENFQESGQGSLDVGGVDSFALWDEIRIDYALRVKENKDHLLCP
jgi:hypothetical protein